MADACRDDACMELMMITRRHVPRERRMATAKAVHLSLFRVIFVRFLSKRDQSIGLSSGTYALLNWYMHGTGEYRWRALPVIELGS